MQTLIDYIEGCEDKLNLLASIKSKYAMQVCTPEQMQGVNNAIYAVMKDLEHYEYLLFRRNWSAYL